MRYLHGGVPKPVGWLSSYVPGKTGGIIFRDQGAGPARVLTAEERAEIAARDAAARRKRVESAQRLVRAFRYDQAFDHARAKAYIEARGVKIADLPGGRLPKSIRFALRCYRSVEIEGKKVDRQEPAILCVGRTADGTVENVQRIYLHEQLPKKAEGENCKALLGSTEHGAAVRLANVEGTGVLVICEGVETGLALAAAVKGSAGVWAMITGGTLNKLQLLPKHHETLKKIIIAGDADTAKRGQDYAPGEHYARIALNALMQRFPGVEVAIALPRHAQYPDLLTEDQQPIAGKSVDWLDVYNAHGAASVRDVVMGAKGVVYTPGAEEGAEPAAALGDGGGGDVVGDSPSPTAGVSAASIGDTPMWDRQLFGGGLIFGDNNDTQARQLLMRAFAPHGSGGKAWAGETFRLAMVGESTFVYSEQGTGTHRWWPIPPDRLTTYARGHLDYFQKFVNEREKPLQPSSKLAAAVLDACRKYVDVPVHNKLLLNSLPTFIDEQFDEDGEPMFRPTFRIGATKPDPPMRRESVIAGQNGIINVDDIVAHKPFRVHPPTPRWLTRCYLPHVFDERFLGDLLKRHMEDVCKEDPGATAREMLRELAPCTHGFIEHCSKGDPRWQDTFWRSMGYLLVPDLSGKNIFWWQGQPGQGKGTATNLHYFAIGHANSHSTTIQQIANRFDAISMIGMLSTVISEIHTDRHTDNGAAVSAIKQRTGRDKTRIEAKFGNAWSEILDARFLITPNVDWEVRDDSGAMVRRLVPLYFGEKPKHEDKSLDVKLEREAEYIFARSLIGLVDQRLARINGEPDYVFPDSSYEIFDSVRVAGSDIQAMMDDCMVIDRESSISADMAMRVWQYWKRTNRSTYDIGAKKLSLSLKAAVTGFRKVQNHTTVGGSRETVYFGLRPRLVGEEGAERGSLGVYDKTGRDKATGQEWWVDLGDESDSGANVYANAGGVFPR